MGLSTAWVAVLPVSLTGPPLAYILNKTGAMENPVVVLLAGVIVLSLVLIIPFTMMIIRGEKYDHPIFYVLSVFTFSSVIDLVFALENDGILDSFMRFYILEGEPYLGTAYGTMIMYWDGIAHLIMYFTMVARQSKGESYREVGLYWAGSLGHSMIVFLPGNVAGKFGIKWSFLLNVPYLIIPFWAAARFLRSGTTTQVADNKTQGKPLWKRPQDIFFILYFIAATGFTLFRGVTVLGCKSELCQVFINQYEPYLKEDNLYPKMQMLIYMFYFVPYYVTAICGLWYGQSQLWMSDWALLHAGAAAQGQFSYIGGALHHSTDVMYRIPSTPNIRLLFLLVNGVLFVVPQLFVLRCLYGRTYKPPPPQEKTITGESTGHKRRKHYKQK